MRLQALALDVIPDRDPVVRTGNHGTVQLPIACADHWPMLGTSMGACDVHKQKIKGMCPGVLVIADIDVVQTNLVKWK